MSKLIALFLLFSVSYCRIVMTKTQWVERMEKVANEKSYYKNVYPYNVLYWDGTQWSADCSNLQKALFNGRDVYNPTKDSYQHDLSNTGDCTTEGLFDQCTSKSSDFTKLKSGEPRILHLNGHIGAYIGKEVKRSKGVCNVVECTVAFEGGILYSYVDSNGNRYSYKGGPKSSAKWTGHGLPSKWVSF